jgi:predicted ester cyclase
VTGITIDRIEGSRIAESWTNWDTLGLMQQLGAIPTGAAKTSA